MKTTRLFVLAPLCALLFVGCAGGPKFRDYSATVSPVKEGEGRVWFYRPSKMAGSLVQPAVMLNDQKIGKAQPGCFFYADRPAGSYEVKLTTEWSHKCQVSFATDSVKYIRLGLAPGFFVGHIIPKQVEETPALKELESLRLITADGANKELVEQEKKKKAD